MKEKIFDYFISGEKDMWEVIKKLKQKLPSNIIPAYDGLNFNF